MFGVLVFKGRTWLPIQSWLSMNSAGDRPEWLCRIEVRKETFTYDLLDFPSFPPLLFSPWTTCFCQGYFYMCLLLFVEHGHTRLFSLSAAPLPGWEIFGQTSNFPVWSMAARVIHIKWCLSKSSRLVCSFVRLACARTYCSLDGVTSLFHDDLK